MEEVTFWDLGGGGQNVGRYIHIYTYVGLTNTYQGKDELKFQPAG